MLEHSQVPENDEEDDRDDPVSTDDQYDVMLDEKNEAVETEIQALLDDLADDETAEVLALAWIGRGTFEPEDWEDALAEASDGERNDAADQLMDMPMLAAYLEAGLAAFGMSCEGIGQLD